MKKNKYSMSAESVVILLALLASPANAQTGTGGGTYGITMGSPGNVNGSVQGPATAPGAGPDKDAMVTTVDGIPSSAVVTSDPNAGSTGAGVAQEDGGVPPGAAPAHNPPGNPAPGTGSR